MFLPPTLLTTQSVLTLPFTGTGIATARLLFWLSVLGLLSSTVFSVLVALAAVRFRSRDSADETTGEFPALSLLKPLHGDEPGLAEHLESFFVQDYPAFEILFCARSEHDPGMLVARRVAARHPRVPVRFLTTGEPHYINAKVASLEVMGAAAAHEILVISDSDVYVSPNYLRDIALSFANSRVGALTCLYRGKARENLWAQLEALGMSVEMTAGVLVANMMEGMQFLLGPTMAVRRECVDKIGGFGVLGDYCADDFLLGKRIAEAGYSIVLSRHVIDHVIVSESFLDTQKHQIRWMRSTRFSRPLGHLGTGLTFSVPYGLLALFSAASMHRPGLGLVLLTYSVVARMLLALVTGAWVVAQPDLLRSAAVYPLRDLLGFLYWAASYSSDLILWRGREFRLLGDGLMAPVAEVVPEEESPVSAGI